MKRVAIFQANLKVGGIQRSLVNLLESGFFDCNYEVDVFLFSKEIFYDINGLPNNIHINFLAPFPYFYRFVPFEILRKLCQRKVEVSKYDYVVDYDSYRQECAFYTSFAVNAKKIMWIHNDMVLEYSFNKKYRILYHFFKGKYKYYDEFVAVSKGIIESFRIKSRQKDCKVTVIPNIIDVKSIIEKSKVPTEIRVDKECLNVVCIGRLYLAKGYEFLLRDFEIAYRQNDRLRLYIIGEGPDYKKYLEWVKMHKLQDVVFFLGKKENPFCIMQAMDAFCLESRYEGQGMVFMEAKVLGLQLIFPKRLEKYNIDLVGTDDVVSELVNLEKIEKRYDDLSEYNNYIYEGLSKVFRKGRY